MGGAKLGMRDELFMKHLRKCRCAYNSAISLKVISELNFSCFLYNIF